MVNDYGHLIEGTKAMFSQHAKGKVQTDGKIKIFQRQGTRTFKFQVIDHVLRN